MIVDVFAIAMTNESMARYWTHHRGPIGVCPGSAAIIARVFADMWSSRLTHASLRAANLRLCRHRLRIDSSATRSSASSFFSSAAISVSVMAPSSLRSNAPGPSDAPCEPGERSPNATRSDRCCLDAEFSSYHPRSSRTYSSSGTNSRGVKDARSLLASAVATVTAISSDTLARDRTCALSTSSASFARSSSSSTSSAARSAMAFAATAAAVVSLSV